VSPCCDTVSYLGESVLYLKMGGKESASRSVRKLLENTGTPGKNDSKEASVKKGGGWGKRSEGRQKKSGLFLDKKPRLEMLTRERQTSKKFQGGKLPSQWLGP